MLKILINISPLFIIIFIGILLQKIKKTDESWIKTLNGFAINLGLPALIFSSIIKTDFSFSKNINLILVNTVFILGIFLFSHLVGKLMKLNKQNLQTFFICLSFSNIAYMGIPVLTQLYGPEIVPEASLIVAIYLLWQFSIGVGYIRFSQEKENKKVILEIFLKIIKSPLIIAVVLGIIFSSLKVQLPAPLTQSISMIASSVTPVVLIVIGLFIGSSRLGEFKKWIPVLLFSIVTLLFLPAIFYFSLKLFGFVPKAFTSSIMMSAMPLAITPFALAYEFNLNKDFIAKTIVLSTILSIISIPFWTSLLAG